MSRRFDFDVRAEADGCKQVSPLGGCGRQSGCGRRRRESCACEFALGLVLGIGLGNRGGRRRKDCC
ncbi:MAG TPA: hypothetical protein GX011_05950 [Clostridiales bacterium]|jgi:hypothetical protein|nr:hypothetical protein [Clostridiales bacterium]